MAWIDQKLVQKTIDELEAYIEDRERHIQQLNEHADMLDKYLYLSQDANDFYAAEVARQSARIADLEAQLAATIATTEAAAQTGSDAVACPECSTAYNLVDYWCCPTCRRADAVATGADYAEGCAP